MQVIVQGIANMGVIILLNSEYRQIIELVIQWRTNQAQMNNKTCIVFKQNTNIQYFICIGHIFKIKQYQYKSNSK